MRRAAPVLSPLVPPVVAAPALTEREGEAPPPLGTTGKEGDADGLTGEPRGRTVGNPTDPPVGSNGTHPYFGK